MDKMEDMMDKMEEMWNKFEKVGQLTRDIRFFEILLTEADVPPEEQKRLCEKIYDKRLTEVEKII